MTTLYFVRHGKTEWNLEGRYQGAHGDSPLLPTSYTEIAELAAYLKAIQFTHLYTSPLKRAQVTSETLKKALKQPFPVTIVDDLHEFDLGQMEGMAFTDVFKQFPQEIAAFREAPADYDPTTINGETFASVIQRTNAAVQTIVTAAQPTDNILIVSHGAAMVAMIQALLKTPIADIRKDGGLTNSSVTTLETLDGGISYQLLDWNETCFLKRTLSASDTI
ncbi:histidine phosphatase family protein [Latilactobacillus fuchuensis]|uniref:Phosphoglycerate mutase n=1 Tax=Latilactobacillus fuchuensis TaxID=164393 RepID=A0A2N9DVT2_9LACO|nr:histidine phosphatase family protein [Latilactobacillus fuchuensis]SPC38628.1 Phosphoglycerate mutase [Latilactobacillus fuchuensis]